jgi:hypothetical protein
MVIDELGLLEDKEAANSWLRHLGYRVMWRWPSPCGKYIIVEVQNLETGECIKRSGRSSLAALCSSLQQHLGVVHEGLPSISTMGGLRRSLEARVGAVECHDQA